MFFGKVYLRTASLYSLSGWGFGTSFIFPYMGNNNPNWLIFFRGVETTNQLFLEKGLQPVDIDAWDSFPLSNHLNRFSFVEHIGPLSSNSSEWRGNCRSFYRRWWIRSIRGCLANKTCYSVATEWPDRSTPRMRPSEFWGCNKPTSCEKGGPATACCPQHPSNSLCSEDGFWSLRFEVELHQTSQDQTCDAPWIIC